MSNEIRGIAISGVDTLAKYIEVSTIVGNYDAGVTQRHIDECFRYRDGIIFDDDDTHEWFWYWGDEHYPEEFAACKLYTYEEFIDKCTVIKNVFSI